MYQLQWCGDVCIIHSVGEKLLCVHVRLRGCAACMTVPMGIIFTQSMSSSIVKSLGEKQLCDFSDTYNVTRSYGVIHVKAFRQCSTVN